MAHRSAPDEEVLNQSSPFVDVNLFTSDIALREAVARAGARSAAADLQAFGGLVGSAKALELGRLANDNPPRLKSLPAPGISITYGLRLAANQRDSVDR